MSPRSNILLVANWPSNVGYAWWLMENFWVTIAKEFCTGQRHCFLAYPKINEVPRTIQTSGISIKELDMRGRSLINLIRIARFCFSKRIGYIYFSDYPARSVFYALLRLFGVREIVVHDHTPGERTKPKNLKKHIKNTLNYVPLINADRMIAVTEFIRSRHIDVYRMPETKCAVAPNGIVPIELDTHTDNYAQSQFDIPGDRLIVVTTGRATYYKGIDFFILCADRLVNVEGRTEFHFLYCGDGPALPDFREQVDSHDLSDYFLFAGNRRDIREILPSCHLGFHAAHGEVGYSLSILEYMSAGLVTIVPDNPSTALATKHLVNGLTYAPGDVEQACETILLTLDIDLSARLRANAIRDVRTRFNIENTNKALVLALEPLIH